MAERQWVSVRRDIVSAGAFERTAPELHSAFLKMVAAEDFDQDAILTPAECSSLRRYIEGYVNAGTGHFRNT